MKYKVGDKVIGYIAEGRNPNIFTESFLDDIKNKIIFTVIDFNNTQVHIENKNINRWWWTSVCNVKLYTQLPKNYKE